MVLTPEKNIETISGLVEESKTSVHHGKQTGLHFRTFSRPASANGRNAAGILSLGLAVCSVSQYWDNMLRAVSSHHFPITSSPSLFFLIPRTFKFDRSFCQFSARSSGNLISSTPLVVLYKPRQFHYLSSEGISQSVMFTPPRPAFFKGITGL